MSSGGIDSLSRSQLAQINKLASEQGAKNKILVAKFKDRSVEFSSVKEGSSFKFLQKKHNYGSILATTTLGLKDRQISAVDAQKIIEIKNRVNSSTHASLEDVHFLRDNLKSSASSLNSDLSSSTTSLDSGIGRSLSGSTQSLDSIGSAQQESRPIPRSELNKALQSELKKRNAIKGPSRLSFDAPQKHQKPQSSGIKPPPLPPKSPKPQPSGINPPPIPPRDPRPQQSGTTPPPILPKPEKFQEATSSSHRLLSERSSEPPKRQTTGFALLSPKAQIAQLKKIKDPEHIGRLLDECDATQKANLAKNKLPVHCRPAMNRRLLADKLEAHTSENPGGMYRQGGDQKVIKKALSNFNKKQISDAVLNDPITAAQLFKRTHDKHKLFDSDTFSQFAEAVQKEPVDQKEFNQAFNNALNSMSADGRDRLKVSLKVMSHAYQAAPEERASNTETDPAVAKRDLAKLFAESVLTFPPLPMTKTSEEIQKSMAMATDQQATGLKIMEALFNRSQRSKQ